MKKIMVMCMAAWMALGGLTACGTTEQAEVEEVPASAPTVETEEPTAETDLQIWLRHGQKREWKKQCR